MTKGTLDSWTGNHRNGSGLAIGVASTVGRIVKWVDGLDPLLSCAHRVKDPTRRTC